MTNDRFRIILGKCKPDRQASAAAAFAELFGIGAALARQIVQAGPIVILSDLARDQAMDIVQALHKLRVQGGDLRVEISDDRSISQVAWPASPRVAGKPIEKYDIKRPRPGELVFNCPECGLTLKLNVKRFAEDLGDDSGLEPAPTPESLAAAADDGFHTGLTPPPGSVGSLHDLVDDQELEPIIRNLRPLGTEGSSTGKVVGGIKEIEVNMAAPPGGQPGAAATARSGRPAPGRPASPSSPGPFSVVIPRCGNPQIIPLLMRDLKLTEDEAREVMKQPLFAVARGMSRESALAIAARYKAIGIQPRIGRRR